MVGFFNKNYFKGGTKMNCWVCEGHGSMIDEENKMKQDGKNKITGEKGKTLKGFRNQMICHYCSGSGFIEINE
jgi:DnaJ-class molecular chaperone